MISMPDGVLPHDYSEPMPDFEDRSTHCVHFAGEERWITEMSVEQDYEEVGIAWDATVIRRPCAQEMTQKFACGSERKLQVVQVGGEGRLRPFDVTVVSERAPGMVHRDHYPVQYEAGNYATGLDYVPRDGYLAELRPDEAHRETAIHGPVRPAPIVHMSPEWIVYRARDPISAASLGWGTGWCTAYPGRLPIWQDYEGGDLYVVQGKGNRKRRRTRYQIHVGHDLRVECARHDNSHMSLAELIERHPELEPWVTKMRDENADRARAKARPLGSASETSASEAGWRRRLLGVNRERRA